MTEHTMPKLYRRGISLVDGAGFVVADCHRLGDTEGQIFRAEFIVRAVNSHEMLLEACQVILKEMNGPSYGRKVPVIRQMLEDALAEADK